VSACSDIFVKEIGEKQEVDKAEDVGVFEVGCRVVRRGRIPPE